MPPFASRRRRRCASSAVILTELRSRGGLRSACSRSHAQRRHLIQRNVLGFIGNSRGLGGGLLKLATASLAMTAMLPPRAFAILRARTGAVP